MNLTAIIADDEELMLLMQRAFLPRKGYEVVAETKHGGNLVELALHYKPDVLLTDNNMPQKEGITAVTQLRAQGYRMPIVINSGKPFELIDADASWTQLEEGQWYNPRLDTHLIAKPYTLAGLASVLARANPAQVTVQA